MSGAHGRTNRLAGESSPYLRLHAHNPVDWYPWGEEAIARARREAKPIFLSVGYSTCYWCHVMERESFSDPAIAEQLNRAFVSVKVDREERPEIDEIYMLATQLLTGQGGWPNSLFLTPELVPFFAGTYFPPDDRWGRPGFANVLRSMTHAWDERRGEVESQAAELVTAMRRHLAESEPFLGPLPAGEPADRALAALRSRFDPSWGGFGQAPKFPSPANLFLLAELAPERPEAAMMLQATLDAMARGGLQDQLAGGFHRYATDREWKVPHFEKMLYDNGLLLEVYAREAARSGSEDARRVALRTAAFLGQELTAPEGGFWSAIDAETGGHEGAYYVWTRREIAEAIGEEGAAFLAPILGFLDAPFFEGDRFVLHLPRPLDVQARERRMSRDELLAELEPLIAELLAARGGRERPATDDKVLTDWNGTAIAGLAVGGAALGEPALLARAVRAVDFVLAALRDADGTLCHVWRAGRASIPAFLSDYVFLVRALLRLHEATGERRWLDEALRLVGEQERRLGSPAGGYFNAAPAEDLLFRPKELFDGALPAANGIAALNWLDLARATDSPRYLEAAERTLRAFAPLVDHHPDGAKTLALALRRYAAALAAAGGAAARGGAAPREGVSAAAGEPAGTALAASRMLQAEARGAVEVTLRVGDAEEDGWRRWVLMVVVQPGWHLAGEAGALGLAAEGLELRDLTPPAPRFEPGAAAAPGRPSHRGTIELSGGARATREPGVAKLRLTYQACDERRCLAPVTLEIAWPR